MKVRSKVFLHYVVLQILREFEIDVCFVEKVTPLVFCGTLHKCQLKFLIQVRDSCLQFSP